MIDKIVDFIAAIIHGSEDRADHKSGVKYALQDLDRLLRSQSYIPVKSNMNNDLPCQCRVCREVREFAQAAFAESQRIEEFQKQLIARLEEGRL